MPTVAEKRATFRKLHQSGCFALPNPWDIGSACYLQHLGFKAIATSSAGFAFSRGLPDNAVALDTMLSHIRELVDATDIPVNADFENGYSSDLTELTKNVKLCVGTGVAGLSIEDASGDKGKPMYELNHAVDRIRAAREAIGSSGVMLVGRAECFLVGEPYIHEVIRRLVAYAEAGADCLYAPGIETPEHVAAVVAAVTPKPVNLLVSGPGEMTLKHAAELGVRRVSVGGALARAAWGGFTQAAEQLAKDGTFAGFSQAAKFQELNTFFREDAARRIR